MTSTLPRWHAKRTVETEKVEQLLRKQFERVDSYRYNSASIRLRVIDPRFEGLSREKRDEMVERYLEQLPPDIQRDIVSLFTFAPSEMGQSPATFKGYLLNVEFEDPSPSML
jgi:stress-induced morphogen